MVELTNRELGAAIMALDGYRPAWGEERNDAVYSAVSKLRMELGVRLAEAAKVMPKRKRGEGPAIVAALKAAAIQRFKVEMTYVDAHGEVTVRVIRPFYFTDAAQKKMLSAWCELRDEERNFRTDRIARITVLNERFTVRQFAYATAGR